MTVQPSNTGWQAFEEGMKHGLCMIPGRYGTKIPLVAWKPYRLRKPSNTEIAAWRKKFPRINALFVTGKPSGVIVLDQDGIEAHKLLGWLGGVPATATVQTPRGENHFHYYLRYTPDLGPIHNFAGGYYNELPNIDLRADGGLAVYPGAVNDTGRAYAFREDHGFGEIQIADLRQCQWLYDYIKRHNESLNSQEAERQARVVEAERLRSLRQESVVLRLRQSDSATDYARRLARYAEVARQKQLERVANSLPGTRNSELNRAAYVLAAFVNEGLWSEAELERDLELAAIQAGLGKDPNCGASDIRRTIASGLSAGRRNRITLPDREPRRAQR